MGCSLDTIDVVDWLICASQAVCQDRCQVLSYSIPFGLQAGAFQFADSLLCKRALICNSNLEDKRHEGTSNNIRSMLSLSGFSSALFYWMILGVFCSTWNAPTNIQIQMYNSPKSLTVNNAVKKTRKVKIDSDPFYAMWTGRLNLD